MNEPTAAAAPTDDAWHPGVGTGIPAEYRGLETIFRPECSSSNPAEIAELETLTGLPSEELTAFRPERLALHEVIVRVTADLAVAEGEIEENFGQNFRAIARLLLAEAVEPNSARIAAEWWAWRDKAATEITRILETALAPPPMPPAKPARWLGQFFGRLLGRNPRVAVAPPPIDDATVVAGFRRTGLAAGNPEARAIYRSIYRVLGAIQIRRGRIGGDTALLARLVTDHVANAYGSQLLGEWLTPALNAAIERHRLSRVPPREAPVLISLKGASAAGKSSLRPMIKQLLREEGIEPDGYATISPDVWRRLLIDYEGLGAAYRYAGHLTSRELMVIDGKLDRYIRRKATLDHAIPHLLVDRFRFDSFESEKIGRVLHETYARYVDTLYMYFVITPPEETVVRGWQRALERGRYKAVEDFLGHSVEAYSGIPKVFFKWLAHESPLYRYSFLDNRVPKGSFPKTIAFGTQREMTICNPIGLVDIARYQRIDVNAETADAVYPASEDFSIEANCGFLDECLYRLPLVRFAEAPDAPPYAIRQGGEFTIVQPERLASLRADPELDRAFAHMLGE